MPIELKPAAWIGTMVFPTIQEAQAKEIRDLMGDWEESAKQFASKFIVDHTDEVVAILTCTPVKKQKKPRSDKGKKRTPKLDTSDNRTHEG